MASYRCYRLDAKNKFIGVEIFDADSYQEACDRCDKVVKEKGWFTAELWELKRQVNCSGPSSD
jgi:hypothetical protein